MLEREEENYEGNIGSRVTLSIGQCEQQPGVVKSSKFLFIQLQIVVKEICTSFEIEAPLNLRLGPNGPPAPSPPVRPLV
jgi:hypothetical protein